VEKGNGRARKGLTRRLRGRQKLKACYFIEMEGETQQLRGKGRESVKRAN